MGYAHLVTAQEPVYASWLDTELDNVEEVGQEPANGVTVHVLLTCSAPYHTDNR